MTTEKPIKKVTSVWQSIFKAAFWIFLCSLGLLFLPQSILSSLYLTELLNEYRHIIGLLLLLSVTYIVCYLLNIIIDETIKFLIAKKKTNTIKLKIKSLDLSQRALLREFFLRGVTVLSLPIEEDAVYSLAKADILLALNKEEDSISMDGIAQYKIAPLARKHLNRKVLGLPYGELTDRDIIRLSNTRPKYLLKLKSYKRSAA